MVVVEVEFIVVVMVAFGSRMSCFSCCQTQIIFTVSCHLPSIGNITVSSISSFEQSEFAAL